MLSAALLIDILFQVALRRSPGAGGAGVSEKSRIRITGNCQLQIEKRNFRTRAVGKRLHIRRLEPLGLRTVV
jgi:hypothetical protein